MQLVLNDMKMEQKLKFDTHGKSIHTLVKKIPSFSIQSCQQKTKRADFFAGESKTWAKCLGLNNEFIEDLDF